MTTRKTKDPEACTTQEPGLQAALDAAVAAKQTPADVSEKYKIPEGTLAQWRSRGYGPPYARIGKHVRYDPVATEAWFAEQVVQPRQAAV